MEDVISDAIGCAVRCAASLRHSESDHKNTFGPKTRT